MALSRTIAVCVALVLAAAAAFAVTRPAGSQTDQTSAVRRVVETYEVAILGGEGDTACAQLTSAARAELLRGAAAGGFGNSCAQVGSAVKSYVDGLFAHAPSPERAAPARRLLDKPPVEVVSIDGDTATARISHTARQPIHLVKQDAGWRISKISFGPSGP